MAARTPTAIAALAGVLKRRVDVAPGTAERQVPVAAHREHQAGRGALDGQRADEDRDEDDEQVELADGQAADESSLRFSLIVVAIGKPTARPSAIEAAMSWNARMTAEQEDRADEPGEPDRRQDAARRLPAGVERLLAERPGGVEAVHDESAMKKPTRKTGEVVAVCAASAVYEVSTGRRPAGHWRRTAG